MSNLTAARYMEFLRNDQPTKLALLACSAALQLDDETACEAVELVAQTNGSSYELVRYVKELGCVWKEWNGYWHVSEDVRRDLFDWLYREIPEPTIEKLRELFAKKADARAAQIASDDEAAAHERMLASFEAAYHRVLIPGQLQKGANELVELWRALPSSTGYALALSVDYLAEELDQRLGRLPDEIVFLRGIAAREQDDNHAQEKHFGLVWKRGRRGQHSHIHALAAHFIGLLIQQRDPKTAERALRDGLEWMEDGPERGRVCYSLGKLLENDPNRWTEADEVYQKASDLLVDHDDKTNVSLARANLLHKSAVSQSQSEGTLNEDLDPPIQVPETWTSDDAVTIESLRALVHEQAYEFVMRYLHRRDKIDTTTLANDLYGKFFEPHATTWQDRAEFFGYLAQLIRRMFISRASTQYSTKLDADLHSRWVHNVSDFGTQPDADLLALDDALGVLEKIDPDQARIVELLFYIGLTVEETADVMQLPVTTVADEWRIAKAFLKCEIKKGKIVLRALNTASLMSSTTNLSLELR